jgi:hypothetical protein
LELYDKQASQELDGVPTAGVTGAGWDADSAGEQKKLEARKLLENGDESPASSVSM